MHKLFTRPGRILVLPSFLCAILGLFIIITGCKDYSRNHLELTDRFLRYETFEMFPVDSINVRYELEAKWSNSFKDLETIVQNRTASITTEVYPSDTPGVVRVVFRTNRTSSGSYPLRISFKNKNGDFTESVTTLHVANFVDVLIKDNRSFEVLDSFSSYPFSPDYTPSFTYYFKAKQIVGRPANELIFSAFGNVSSEGNVRDVTVRVDSMTGELTSDLHHPGRFRNYSGKGQLKNKHSNYGDHQLGGYFHYDCESYYSGRHAGRINLN